MIFHNIGGMEKKLETCMQTIKDRIYEPIAHLKIEAWKTSEPVPFEERKSGEKIDLNPGEKWGDLFDCAWFHVTGQVPDSGKGKNIVLIIDVNGEALVFDKYGNPIKGLTSGSSVFDTNLGTPVKQVVPFKNPAEGGELIELWLDVGNNDLFGNLQNKGRLEKAFISVCHNEMRSLYYDFEILYHLLLQLPETSSRYQRILFALHKSVLALNEYTEKEAKIARHILAPELSKKAGDYSLKISAIGHAHLDLAWLWPIRETIRKGARTFSNVLYLMERYPDFIFGASQAQLYQWMKEHYPTIYQRIKEKISQGRWEPLGGMWVEPDTNIPGGESLIRQILYGKRFFKDEFGLDSKHLFLPDTFGFSAALPQIMTKSNMDYFVTTKLSWDEFNRYPHHTFIWRGIDGSEVLAHMPPEETYNSAASPHSIKKAECNYRDKAVSENCLVVYGIGNGGGGPGAEHLERLKREKNLAGMAPVIQEKVETFFHHLEKNRDDYATWVGELYLGKHQGTYTTQAKNKWFNRKMEIALRELEFLSVWDEVLNRQPYAKEKIDRIWKEILLYQFHDILPGSSIGRVYAESLKRYESLEKDIKNLSDFLITDLLKNVNTSDFVDPIVVVNSLSWDREDWIKIDKKWYWVHVPSLGFAIVDGQNPILEFPEIIAQERVLENERLRVRFSDDGFIYSIVDKESKKEIIPEGEKANILSIYQDDGDAWDISIDYEYKKKDFFRLISSEIRIDGPKAIMKQTREYGHSRMVQEIILTAGSKQLDFFTEIDWKEKNKMLRVSFPVTIHATESVSEIQFGHIKRPNHHNTSWELAKYEMCAHKWVDISEPDYGIALLNDSKYGHRVIGNVLDLNLLRSPTYPDLNADRGTHKFAYAFLPHIGNYIAAQVVQKGYEFNMPLNIRRVKKQNGNYASNLSFLQLDQKNIIVETIKKAEEGNGIVLRLYEAYGIGNRVKVKFEITIKSAYITNMLEENRQRLTVKNNTIQLVFKPFEIHTILVERN